MQVTTENIARRRRFAQTLSITLWVALVTSSAFADENHFEDSGNSLEDEIGGLSLPESDDFFQSGFSDGSKSGRVLEASLGSLAPIEVPRKPRTVPRDEQGRLLPPAIFQRAALIYQSAFTTPKRPVVTRSSLDFESRKGGVAERKPASVPNDGNRTMAESSPIDSGPRTVELTRQALAAEERFEKPKRQRRRVTATYDKILSAIESNRVVAERIESDDETSTPQERRAKRIARKARPQKAAVLAPIKANY